jgi:AraC family transcriptional regulator of adaptative response/methylated-DNA-[protein]-cysteine methyltransferase
VKQAPDEMTLPPRETLLAALRDRDPGFDGTFFAAAANSGVFCRPSCADHPGNIANLRLFELARDALAAGFRPCKHCRPLHAGDADPEWLPRLMEAVDEEPARRWHDHDLANLDIDPATARRWFINNHGLTFHAYSRLRRLGTALRQMQLGQPLTQAILDSGYESEGAFREAFSLVFGHPPSAVDRESCVWINRAATPLGSMIMGVADRGLYLLEFAERRMLDTQLKRLRQELGRVFLPGEHPVMHEVQRQLDAYFEGSLREFTLQLQASGTAFQEQVWQALLDIPYGQMRSYADVAHQIGQPEAVRAVGRANGDNRIAIVIPCHRVVGSDGNLTGYGGGLWRKQYLLALEQSQAFSLA